MIYFLLLCAFALNHSKIIAFYSYYFLFKVILAPYILVHMFQDFLRYVLSNKTARL